MSSALTREIKVLANIGQEKIYNERSEELTSELGRRAICTFRNIARTFAVGLDKCSVEIRYKWNGGRGRPRLNAKFCLRWVSDNGRRDVAC